MSVDHWLDCLTIRFVTTINFCEISSTPQALSLLEVNPRRALQQRRETQKPSDLERTSHSSLTYWFPIYTIRERLLTFLSFEIAFLECRIPTFWNSRLRASRYYNFLSISGTFASLWYHTYFGMNRVSVRNAPSPMFIDFSSYLIKKKGLSLLFPGTIIEFTSSSSSAAAASSC